MKWWNRDDIGACYGPAAGFPFMSARALSLTPSAVGAVPWML